MNSERRWQSKLVGRILLNAFCGALSMALIAAVCGGAAGAMGDWLTMQGEATLGIPRAPGISAYWITQTTVLIGTFPSFFAGAIIFGIAAAKAAPGRTFAPLHALIGRVALGMALAALGACSALLAFAGVKTALSGESFFFVASLDAFWLFVAAPALMLFGAIAGALTKRN